MLTSRLKFENKQDIETNFDNEIIPSIDTSHIFALLQSVTPIQFLYQ